MIVILDEQVTDEQVQKVIAHLVERGFDIHRSTGVSQIVLGVVGDTLRVDTREFAALDGVQKVIRITERFKLVSRTFKSDNTVVEVGAVEVGGNDVIMMAGSSGLTSADEVRSLGENLRDMGTSVMWSETGSAVVSLQADAGLDEAALKNLRKVADECGMAAMAEVSDHGDITHVVKYVDLVRVGARNMQNFTLLKELGKTTKPVLLQRGVAATLKELLMAAEYILAGGNRNVILCERGIRTFEHSSGYTLDVGAIPALKELTHLPIVVDPSHSAGGPDKVAPLARAAVAAGADGLLINVRLKSDMAAPDRGQTLTLEQYRQLVAGVRTVADAVGRKLR